MRLEVDLESFIKKYLYVSMLPIFEYGTEFTLADLTRSGVSSSFEEICDQNDIV